MALWFYNTGIRIYSVALHLAALIHPKAAKWVNGRRNWRTEFAQNPALLARSGDNKTLWMHVSSLGEFEQGRPVLEKLKAAHPQLFIVLSFFSPSGFEIRKNYSGADFICYLPADTPENAADFLEIIHPDIVVFVKYDFWANYLRAIRKRNIPLLLVASVFRAGQPFFKWYGGFWRGMLACFNEIHVQDPASLELLKSIHYQHAVLAGDTRIDRVLALAAHAGDDDKTKAFVRSNHPVFIAGSIWEADEAVILPVLTKPEFAHYKIILAPHDPSEPYVMRLSGLLPGSVRYSRLNAETDLNSQVLIIDNIGLLNKLYRLGDIAYIGGGFGKGIHNTLEPAAFALPVIFGPKYHKFGEARQFITLGGAFSVKDSAGFEQVMIRLQDPAFRKKASEAVKKYLTDNQGASSKALQWLEEWM